MSAAAETMKELTAIDLIRESLENLENLATMKIAAANAFRDEINAMAEQTKMDKTVLRQYIMARVKDKLEAFQQKQEQMELLFGEIE